MPATGCTGKEHRGHGPLLQKRGDHSQRARLNIR